jgi:hypothetical protein
MSIMIKSPVERLLDPDKEPNNWLAAVLRDLVDQNTEESKESLKSAITDLVCWVEPGVIDSLFYHWIKEYKVLMAQSKKS